jgi:hypothetical protein
MYDKDHLYLLLVAVVIVLAIIIGFTILYERIKAKTKSPFVGGGCCGAAIAV